MKPKRNGVGNVRRMNVVGMAADIPITILVTGTTRIITRVPLISFSFGRKTVTGINAVIMEESATRKIAGGGKFGIVVDVVINYGVIMMDVWGVSLRGKLC